MDRRRCILYRTNQKNLRWTQMGKAGDWEDTIAWASDRGSLWSIETDGTLYQTNANGDYKQVGAKGTYSGMTNLAALNSYLYTIENGTLYRTK